MRHEAGADRLLLGAVVVVVVVVQPISKRLLSLLVIGMCMSVLLAEVGLMAGETASVAVLSRGR